LIRLLPFGAARPELPQGLALRAIWPERADTSQSVRVISSLRGTARPDCQRQEGRSADSELARFSTAGSGTLACASIGWSELASEGGMEQLHASTPRAGAPNAQRISKGASLRSARGSVPGSATLRPEVSGAKPHGSAGPQCASKCPNRAALREKLAISRPRYGLLTLHRQYHYSAATECARRPLSTSRTACNAILRTWRHSITSTRTACAYFTRGDWHEV